MRLICALLLVACSATQEPPPCDPTSYAALSATCGDDEDICNAKIEERERFCAEKIRSGE